MGKTTLGRLLEAAASQLKIKQDDGRVTHARFTRISYDIVFTSLRDQFVEDHPECDPQEAFDHIRADADSTFEQ